MEKVSGQILKGNSVEIEGRFRLGAEQAPNSSENKTNPTSAPAQANIVENHPEFAVVEVTCCCGTKTHIRCEYADAKTNEQETGKKNDGDNNNEN